MTGEPVVGTRVGVAANGQSGESSRSAPFTVQTDTMETMAVFFIQHPHGLTNYRVYHKLACAKPTNAPSVPNQLRGDQIARWRVLVDTDQPVAACVIDLAGTAKICCLVLWETIWERRGLTC